MLADREFLNGAVATDWKQMRAKTLEDECTHSRPSFPSELAGMVSKGGRKELLGRQHKHVMKEWCRGENVSFLIHVLITLLKFPHFGTIPFSNE